jgi:hypothetical protein
MGNDRNLSNIFSTSVAGIGFHPWQQLAEVRGNGFLSQQHRILDNHLWQ